MKRPALLFLIPAALFALYDMQWFDLNHWKVPFYNDGRWGIDVTQGSGVAGGSWPQPLRNCYIFGAGAWLGAVVAPADTLCTIFYDPNSGGTEACPTLCRYWREGTGDARDRIYVYPGDWPPSHSRFPMAPLWPLSDMDMWCACSDSDPANHDSLGRPLGVDVCQTVCGFSDSLAQDFFYLRYEITNCSGDSLRGSYFGPALDPDIGDAADDGADVILDHVFIVGQDTIRVRNLAFAYDWNNMENPGAQWESGAPGTVAMALLAAPDSLGLTAFKRLALGSDPTTDVGQYLTLAGYDWMTREYRPYDSTDVLPSDKRFVMSCGPFDLAPQSTATFWYVVIGSPFGTAGQLPHLRDTSDLALRYKWALEFWRRLFPGIAETRPAPLAPRSTLTATIIGNVLFLPASPRHGVAASTALVDASGRIIMSLRPGPNDVSALSPGVYFVREARAQAVRKIVLTR
jgi:hypothetical protein